MTKLTDGGLAQMAVEPADADRLYIVDDPAGSPISKYIEYSDLAVNLSKLDGANTFTARQTINYATNSGLVINGNTGTSRDIIWQTSGSNRWWLGTLATAESGICCSFSPLG